MEQQKATPVQPPSDFKMPSAELRVVEVNMTYYYYTAVGLTLSTLGLGGFSTYLWRRLKRQEEYMEAIREYVSRLVNETNCGKSAYVSLLDEIEEVEQELVERKESDADSLSFEDEEVDRNLSLFDIADSPTDEKSKPVLRRARDIKPNI